MLFITIFSLSSAVILFNNTRTLREFIIKKFALDDERLLLDKCSGPDYFKERFGLWPSKRRFYLIEKGRCICERRGRENNQTRVPAQEKSKTRPTWRPCLFLARRSDADQTASPENQRYSGKEKPGASVPNKYS